MSKETILAGLAPMFEQADREGLMFFCQYQHIWCTPDELRKQQANGSLVWGAVNWRLRPVSEFLAPAVKPRDEAQAELDRRLERVKDLI